MGPPGSGKGTQADLVKSVFQLTKLSSGDVFRSLSSENTDIARKAKAIMDAGKLLPDDIVTEVILSKLSYIDDNYILDGFPRTINQALSLDNYLETKNENISVVINLTVNEDLLIRRISGRITCKSCGSSYNKFTKPTKLSGVCDSCGSTNLIIRDDDNEDSIKIRMNEYTNLTSSLLDYYRNKGVLVEIQGDNELSKVTDDIVRAINSSSINHNLKK